MPRSTSAIQTELDAWYAARSAITAGGQSYTYQGRTLTRASLSEINTTISALERELSRANAAANGRTGLQGVSTRGKLGGMGY